MTRSLVKHVKWVGVIALLVALVGIITLGFSNRNLGKQLHSLQDQILTVNADLVTLKTTTYQIDTHLQTTDQELIALMIRTDEISTDLQEAEVRLSSASPTGYVSSTPLKIAFINAEDAFSVFTDAVSDLRQRAIDKQGEIVKLQQQYMARTISKDDFDSQNNQLQVELLQAQLNIDVGTIDKMIASTGFSDMKSDLQRLKDEAQPVVDEMKNLVSAVRVGVIDTTEFQNRYTQVKNAFTQLDHLLTQAATTKIVETANKVALAEGYDLVLRVKNVIVYRNAGKITDITDLVKRELRTYL